eukprot:3589575-Amphidinium_carterae.1
MRSGGRHARNEKVSARVLLWKGCNCSCACGRICICSARAEATFPDAGPARMWRLLVISGYTALHTPMLLCCERWRCSASNREAGSLESTCNPSRARAKVHEFLALLWRQDGEIWPMSIDDLPDAQQGLDPGAKYMRHAKLLQRDDMVSMACNPGDCCAVLSFSNWSSQQLCIVEGLLHDCFQGSAGHIGHVCNCD